jgi:branched-subunit amino acid transport protein
MAAAVLTAIVLTILLPEEQRALPQWVVPLVEGILAILGLVIARAVNVFA